MPILRYSLLTVMGAIALIALWLATFRMDISIGRDVRGIFRLSILIIAAAGVLHYRGKGRAFWIGFLFVLLMYSSHLSAWLTGFELSFEWMNSVANHFSVGLPPKESTASYYNIYDTLWLACVFAISCLGGCISLAIYNNAHRRSP